MPWETVNFTREQLHQLVWERPVQHVVESIGVSEGMFQFRTDHALRRTVSSSGLNALQLSAINANDFRLSNPLVPHGRCTT